MPAAYEYRPVRFFLVTTIVTWIPWFIGAFLARNGGRLAEASLLGLLGMLGPLTVGLGMILGSGHPELKRDLRDRIVNLARIRPVELLGALAIPPLVSAGSIALSRWWGQPADQFKLSGSGNLLSMAI